MALYGNSCSDVNFHFILKEVEAEEATQCLFLSLARDSEMDTSEYHSYDLLEPSCLTISYYHYRGNFLLRTFYELFSTGKLLSFNY